MDEQRDKGESTDPDQPKAGKRGYAEPRVDAWVDRTQGLMVGLAVLFLVGFAWPILHPELGPWLALWLIRMNWLVWVCFAVEFGIRLLLARHRWAYARRHWYDVLLVVLPMLQPLKLLRLLTVIRFFGNSAAGAVAGKVVVYVVGITMTAMALGALGVLKVERDAPGANITTVGDSFWWAMTTVTTVGYGDLYPVTTAGRYIAAALMLVGVGLVGTVTATVSGWFISRVDQERRGRR